MVRRPAKVSLDTGLILVIDGDNTLWDTNGVFEKAQRWLLRSLRRARPRDPTTGGINTLEQVETLLKDGDADLVAIGMALLADPYWLQHAPEYIEMFGMKYCPRCGHKV